MKLIEALDLVRRSRAGTDEPVAVQLACGFTPLHLETFLAAHLQRRRPTRSVQIVAGMYGDLAGTLERAAPPVDTVVAVIEWSDLDPRLGVRALGGWAPSALPEVVTTVTRAAARLRAALERRAETTPIALALPTLPIAPVRYAPAGRADALDAALDGVVQTFTAWAAVHPRIALVRGRRLDAISPPGDRLDVASELRAGFPYRLGHADALADLLAALVVGPQPKKGLITDLDDTLWRGVLGELGTAGIRWDFPEGHVHALYQQCLASLAESGVLVAVASKNDPALVDTALARRDLLIGRERLYPVRAGWSAKSGAVSEILRAWNLGAADVVFVDDSPMELGEVAAAHPGIACVRFAADDPDAAWATLARLRDLFGRTVISVEDGLRAASLRDRAAVETPASDTPGFEAFLAEAGARVALDFRLDAADPRALELVNKTNQFALNGRRLTTTEWRALLERPRAFLLRVAYEDRFGPLGTIAVVAGAGSTVSAWAMSCRAFSRRIEHQCLRGLFDRLGADEIALEYAKTDRNGPFQDFLGALMGPSLPGAGLVISRRDFEAACPPLHHTLHEVPDG